MLGLPLREDRWILVDAVLHGHGPGTPDIARRWLSTGIQDGDR